MQSEADKQEMAAFVSWAVKKYRQHAPRHATANSPAWAAWQAARLDVPVLKAQVESLQAALQRVLDAREKEAKAHFAFQTASDNYASGAAREGRQHMAAMTAASNAEKDARLLLATLKTPNAERTSECLMTTT